MSKNFFAEFEDKLNRVKDDMIRFGLEPNKVLFEEVEAFLHFLDGRYGRIEETKQRDFVHKLLALQADIASKREKRINEMEEMQAILSDLTLLKYGVLEASEENLRNSQHVSKL